MNFIVCVAENWGIGKNRDLLFHLPQDMAYFKQTTLNKTVVMGDVTLASLPGGKPLKNRDNIVMTLDPDFDADGVTICHGIPDLAEALKSKNDEDVFVIGGASIYRLMEPYCKKAYITMVHAAPQADVYIPDISLMDNWKLVSQSEPHYENGFEFTFDVYENSAPKSLVNSHV